MSLQGIHLSYTFTLHVLVLCCRPDDRGGLSESGTVTALHSGDLSWLRTVSLTALCAMNIEYYPYDEQSCVLRFVSPSYDEYEVKSIH